MAAAQETPKELFPNLHISQVIEEDLTDPEVDMDIDSMARTESIITPEYVEEVKTELSEGRRAGFRFFVKNRTKILAGIGVISSLSIMAIFSGAFINNNVHKAGKVNIQEEVRKENI